MNKITDAELLQNVKEAAAEERRATNRVLNLLMEVERRKLFAQRGYDSLFSFVVQFLNYSEAGAHRRIAAMRALREFPTLFAHKCLRHCLWKKDGKYLNQKQN